MSHIAPYSLAKARHHGYRDPKKLQKEKLTHKVIA